MWDVYLEDIWYGYEWAASEAEAIAMTCGNNPDPRFRAVRRHYV